jgi:hypothetical protein
MVAVGFFVYQLVEPDRDDDRLDEPDISDDLLDDDDELLNKLDNDRPEDEPTEVCDNNDGDCLNSDDGLLLSDTGFDEL